MNSDIIPYSDQLPEGSISLFLKKLSEQLAKDLYPVEWGDFSTVLTPSEIVSRLEACVQTLVEEKGRSLGAVLYRIDISEKKIRVLMAETTSSERIKVLAAQILEREAKKVWMRMHYSAPERGADA
jgi:hypothetical protein